MNLLLVDDDHLLRSQINFSISDMFDAVFEASNKSEAFEIIEKNHIDIALVDLSLDTEFDGMEISKVTLSHGIKTIIFTANQLQYIVKEFIKDGVFDYINKPVEMPTLINALNRAKLFVENENELAKENIFRLSQCVDATEGIKSSLTTLEKDLLVKILNQNDFNIYQTAKLLNTKRENIYYFIKKYNITRD